MACRNPGRAEAARERVAAVATGPDADAVSLDLADLGSVRKPAPRSTASVERLDVLMNNAGVMAVPLARTADGFELQFGTNHLGHFALTGLLLPALQRAPPPGSCPRRRTCTARAATAGTTRTSSTAGTGSGRPTARPSWPTCCSCASSGRGPPRGRRPRVGGGPPGVRLHAPAGRPSAASSGGWVGKRVIGAHGHRQRPRASRPKPAPFRSCTRPPPTAWLGRLLRTRRAVRDAGSAERRACRAPLAIRGAATCGGCPRPDGVTYAW